MYLYLYIIYIVITPDSSGVLRARIFAHLDEITHLQKKKIEIAIILTFLVD